MPLGVRCDQRSSTRGKVSGKIAETGDQLIASLCGPAGYAHRTIAP
jgi:hypothetical protein